MKTTRLLFTLLPVLALVLPAQAQVSPVTMRIEQVTKTDNDKYTHKQSKSLKIFLNNGSSADKTGLLVRYYFFGKGVTDREIVVVDKGEKTADIKARKTEIIETPTVSKTWVEEHFQKKKKVEASGEKLVGYGAQVFEEERLLAQYYSEPSYSKLVSRDR
ncbi:MAG: hypothetical protein M3463_05720 [Verrucomicrobiota bacterium]|nr:hypothetical protein [Verrucomicrobiota bacterium]